MAPIRRAAFLVGTVLALVAASLAACGHDPLRASRTQAPRSEGAPERDERARRERQAEEDARLARAVRGELEVDPAVDADVIAIEANDGVVELSGVVPYLSMADAAVARAQMVHGVVTVIDRLEPAPTGRPDARIRQDVEAALSEESALRLRNPVVRVIDGVVTLRGDAETYEDRQLAERLARAVRGARDVVSQIELVEHPTQSDAEIRDAVEHALWADRWVDEWLLEVEVDDGVVAIRGVQPTAAAKRRVSSAAWVRGVRDVDTTQLEVDPNLTPEQRRPPAGYRYANDAQIARAVNALFARDPHLRGRRLQVAVSNGDVRLSGRVPTLEARRIAAELAESVQGVWDVTNDLLVLRSRRLHEAELEQRVDRALARAAGVDAEALSIEVRGGTVKLMGSVQSPHSKLLVEEIVARVPGVRRLVNEIEAPEVIAEAPSDELLLQSVLAHLEAHPYVDAEDIEVTVSNGEVMLRGEVTDWRAKQEALRAAREAGATDVLDSLEVVEGPAEEP